MKKSTADVNRANYEKARKILFGEENWKTAGIFRKRKEDSKFTLGPFEYEINEQRNILLHSPNGRIEIGKIHRDHIDVTLPNVKKLLGLFSPSLAEIDSSFFFYDGRLYYTYEGHSLASRSLLNPNKSAAPPKNIYPDDYTSLEKIYRGSKDYGTKGSPLVIDWFQETFDFKVHEKEFVRYPVNNIPEGLDRRERSSIVISTGIGMRVFISTQVDPSVIVPYFPTNAKPKITDKFWLESDLQTISHAIDWLMHVLTSPSPGKDGSEPSHMTDRTVKRRWYFFMMDATYEQAIRVRTRVMEFLYSEGAFNFVNKLAKFKTLRTIQDLNNVQITWDQFQAALARIQRFKDYEYLGDKVN